MVRTRRSLTNAFTSISEQSGVGVGVTVSVGGEIGEVGGKNSDVHELHAYMKGLNAALAKRGTYVGLSKISVQTGTAHGGFINADGTVRTDVKIDLQTLDELSRVARESYGLGGAVQHGASTLPPEAFDAFPRVGACEIHLATDFQNMVYEHPRFPADLKAEMLFVWGRQDPHIPFAGREAIRAGLETHGIPYEWHELNAQHAFLCDEGPRYDPALFLQSMAITLAFYRRTLG